MKTPYDKDTYSIWKMLQDLEWDMYLDTPVGVFSVDGLPGAEMTGGVLNRVLNGRTCLDIGCGALAKPAYIRAAPDVIFTGVDPYLGNVEREFNFIEGFAEELPFGDKTFDGALFATSLDHIGNPQKAISEAHRILKDEGNLFIWLTHRPIDEQYLSWKSTGGQYDKYHIQAFTPESVKELTESLFVETETFTHKHNPNECLYIFRKC